jgi:hypothetical protein
MVAKRWDQAKRLLGHNRASALHPDDARAGVGGASQLSLFSRPMNTLANEQSWLGCGRPGCWICSPDHDSGVQRRRAARDWRREWEL